MQQVLRRALLPSFVFVLAAAAYPGSQEPAAKPTRPATTPAPQASTRSLEERRAIAQDAARFETKYRNALARIDRLTELYKAKNDQEHVLQLDRLRERLAVRREHALEGFRRDLGEAGFQKIQSQLQGAGRRGLDERAKKAKPPGGS
jgi:hypothetical protein